MQYMNEILQKKNLGEETIEYARYLIHGFTNREIKVIIFLRLRLTILFILSQLKMSDQTLQHR